MKINRSLFLVPVWFLTLALPLTVLAHEAESPVHDEMQGINKGVRQLGRQITDPAQKASSLELVASIQKHAEKAKTLTPPKAEKMSGDEKTKYVATFQADLDALLKQIAVLKDDITNGKTDAAKADLQKIKQLKDSSHKELGVEMGPPGGGHKHDGPPPGQ